MTQKTPETVPVTAYKGSIPRRPLRFLWFVTRPYKKYMFCALMSVLVAEVFNTSIPFIIKSIVDTAYGVNDGVESMRTLWLWVFAYPLVYAVIFATRRVRDFFGIRWVTRANSFSYNILFQYLTGHSHTYFTNRFAGSLSGKITHASEGTQGIAEQFLWDYTAAVITVVVTFAYMYHASVPIAYLFLVLTILIIALNYFIVRYRRPHVVAYAAQMTKMRGTAVDAITNIAAVRQFARGEYEHAIFGREIEKMRALNIRQWNISEWGKLINNLFLLVFEAGMLVYAVHLWSTGVLTIGDLVLLTTLMASIQGTLFHIGSSMNGFIRRYADVEEGLSDILFEHELKDKIDAKPLVVSQGDITFQKASFQYEESSVFEDFNLAIKAGQRVGLVGSSGAGKSTFVSLLLRQHDLSGGRICIDGQDIAEVTQDSLREHIAIVPQEPMLFHRSIRENIAYGNPNATDEEIIEVAKKAQAHEFISALSQGYDTLVGERGVKLSGGQKQRVAIARAMLKNAPILVLDEATSALDSESEVAIQKALHELMEGKTVIAIAHRLSTLREMDRIIVLDQGKIVEDGTHDALTKNGGMYSRLWEHQAGGFLQE